MTESASQSGSQSAIHKRFPQRRNATSFKPGNTARRGSVAKQAERAAQIAAREETLCKAMIGDLGHDVSPFEKALVKVAAEQLAQAERTGHGEVKVRLTRSALALVDRVRNTIKARKPAPSVWDDVP
jgi:hypothetical protein